MDGNIAYVQKHYAFLPERRCIHGRTTLLAGTMRKMSLLFRYMLYRIEGQPMQVCAGSCTESKHLLQFQVWLE